MNDYEYEEDLKEPTKKIIKSGNYFQDNVFNKELKAVRYPICKGCERFDSMLKLCKEEFDRLMETSPSINEKIVAQFNHTFPTKKPSIDTDKDSSIRKPDIKRPEICDVLISTAEIVFITPDIDKSDLVNQTAMIELTRKKNKIMANYEKEVNDWVTKFEEKHNRKPLESEMLDNLQDKMSADVLNKIVKKLLNEFEKDDNINDPINRV